MNKTKTPPRITLTPSNRLRFPPRAETIAHMPEAAAKVQAMQARVFVISDDKQTARIAQLEAEAAQARQEAEAAKQQLHAHASQVWLEEEARLQQQAREQRIARQHHLEHSRVRDHTLSETAPQAVITADKVKLKLALNPRTAVPMQLPLMSRIKLWLKRKD